jgi:hypothetical protein
MAAARDGYVRGLSDNGRFSGAVPVARDTDVCFERACGFANTRPVANRNHDG